MAATPDMTIGFPFQIMVEIGAINSIMIKEASSRLGLVCLDSITYSSTVCQTAQAKKSNLSLASVNNIIHSS